MIIKLILSTLELDLSNYEFTLIEENNWLKDDTISRYTYPGEIELTIEQDEALGNITEQNLQSYQTLLDAKFYVLGEEHDAILEIQNCIGKRLTFQIRYGLEEFPNYNKQLSQLPLEKFDLVDSIYNYAKTIIFQTWPEVNFNFPQVINEILDTDSEQWQYFEGILNKYVAPNFVQNEFDTNNNEQINRNIMLPMPYVLHVLKTGFEDAGFTLTGEILEDPEYKKATIYSLTDFYTRFSSESNVYTLKLEDYTSISEGTAIYSLNIPFPEPGRYKIAGNMFLRSLYQGIFSPFGGSFSVFIEGRSKLSYNDSVVWQGESTFALSDTYREKVLSVDLNIDYTGNEGSLIFESSQYGLADDDLLIMDITVTQLAKFDNNGNLIPTLVEPTTIDLSKSVPDMNFGEFVTALTKKRNYGIDIIGKEIVINKKRVTNLDKSKAIDLTGFEVQYPQRNFNQAKTFLLKEFDFETDEYKSQEIYISNEGYELNSFIKNDDTEEIVINCIALPLKQFGVLTAHAFLDDNTKLQLVIYGGVNAQVNNLSENPSDISLLNNYLDDYVDWFKFLLNNQNMNWVFEASYEALSDLKIRSIVYAYRQYHVIRRLSRQTFLTAKNGIYFEVEIDTESLD